MSDKTLTEVFTDIADAIRTKKSTSEKYTPVEFATEISTITTPTNIKLWKTGNSNAGGAYVGQNIGFDNRTPDYTLFFPWGFPDGGCYIPKFPENSIVDVSSAYFAVWSCVYGLKPGYSSNKSLNFSNSYNAPYVPVHFRQSDNVYNWREIMEYTADFALITGLAGKDDTLIDNELCCYYTTQPGQGYHLLKAQVSSWEPTKYTLLRMSKIASSPYNTINMDIIDRCEYYCAPNNTNFILQMTTPFNYNDTCSLFYDSFAPNTMANAKHAAEQAGTEIIVNDTSTYTPRCTIQGDSVFALSRVDRIAYLPTFTFTDMDGQLYTGLGPDGLHWFKPLSDTEVTHLGYPGKCLRITTNPDATMSLDWLNLDMPFLTTLELDYSDNDQASEVNNALNPGRAFNAFSDSNSLQLMKLTCGVNSDRVSDDSDLLAIDAFYNFDASQWADDIEDKIGQYSRVQIRYSFEGSPVTTSAQVLVERLRGQSGGSGSGSGSGNGY